MFDQGIARFTAKGEQDLIGSSFHNGNVGIFGQRHMHEFESGPPLRGNFGPAVYNNTGPTFSMGTFAISNQCKLPAEAIRWVDYYYSFEGTLLIRLGQEGVTYIKKPDGSYDITDLIRANPDGRSIPQAFGWYGAIATAGAGCPEFTVPIIERARLEPPVFTGYDVLSPFLSLKAMPVLSFTVTEQQQLNPINSDMITYINESRVQFMTGRRPLSQWDAYVRDVRNMGADRYVALYQTSFDRYMGK